ncbi:hypothetical protein [Pedobacter sp. Leaf194]|uniref:hypothetical protein n=1 Tax=Pedobacter sp. Leaf194 TaxID=1736297 RepID=UPI0012FCF05D|nr:hypothetical protein [Pedobacter sp. Leaf194]
MLRATGGRYEETKPGLFPRLEVNADNGKLLELLKQKGIVKDFPEIKDKNKYRVLPARITDVG